MFFDKCKESQDILSYPIVSRDRLEESDFNSTIDPDGRVGCKSRNRCTKATPTSVLSQRTQHFVLSDKRTTFRNFSGSQKDKEKDKDTDGNRVRDSEEGEREKEREVLDTDS